MRSKAPPYGDGRDREGAHLVEAFFVQPRTTRLLGRRLLGRRRLGLRLRLRLMKAAAGRRTSWPPHEMGTQKYLLVETHQVSPRRRSSSSIGRRRLSLGLGLGLGRRTSWPPHEMGTQKSTSS